MSLLIGQSNKSFRIETTLIFFNKTHHNTIIIFFWNNSIPIYKGITIYSKYKMHRIKFNSLKTEKLNTVIL